MDNSSAFWVVNSLFVFALSVFCAGVLIPQILLISFRKRLFDVPDERKIHQEVVPRLGGIAFKQTLTKWYQQDLWNQDAGKKYAQGEYKQGIDNPKGPRIVHYI